MDNREKLLCRKQIREYLQNAFIEISAGLYKEVKQKLLQRGFKDSDILNNRGKIGAAIDETYFITKDKVKGELIDQIIAELNELVIDKGSGEVVQWEHIELKIEELKHK